MEREERIHDMLRCYGANSGKVFYTKNPDTMGEQEPSQQTFLF